MLFVVVLLVWVRSTAWFPALSFLLLRSAAAVTSYLSGSLHVASVENGDSSHTARPRVLGLRSGGSRPGENYTTMRVRGLPTVYSEPTQSSSPYTASVLRPLSGAANPYQGWGFWSCSLFRASGRYLRPTNPLRQRERAWLTSSRLLQDYSYKTRLSKA